MSDLQANSKMTHKVDCTLRWAVIALACACVARPVVPQGQHPMQGPQVGVTYGSFGDLDPVLAKRQARMLNVERQKQLVSDAAKLLELARALNSELEAANSDSMTPDQMHKIAEIEKLAKSVKDRMTLTVGGVEPAIPMTAIP
ncbi:MAG TPA: hypothetical protein VKR52_07135 [Terracidiphilus sp.]|nr:hypothetical protein [Terracidiphilus sp.]